MAFNVELATWECGLDNGDLRIEQCHHTRKLAKLKLANRKGQNLAIVDLTIWQKWKSELGEILKHLAFHKGGHPTSIYSFMSFKALIENNRWQSCCTKIQSPGSHWQWVMTSQRQIYTPPSLKFRFYDTGSRISFLCTVMLLTRLCISLNSHVRSWRQALTHVDKLLLMLNKGMGMAHEPCLPEKARLF